MNDLFKLRMELIGKSSGINLKRENDAVIDKLFTSDPNYTPCKIYDWNDNFICDSEIKVQLFSGFSIHKDHADCHIQFRPHFHPEKQYLDLYKAINKIPETWNSKDDPLGFYVEFPDDDGDMHKWIIVGKNENRTYTRYNALKCNWNFKWIYDNKIYHQIGALRARNSYNSGIWSDGMFTSVENQSAFWIPNTLYTQTINYDQRFLLSDSRIRPTVFAISKIEDVFPVGLTKYVLKQDKFDEQKDNPELGIANFYDNAVQPGIAYPEAVPDEVSKDKKEYDIVYSGIVNVLPYGRIKNLTATLNGAKITDWSQYSWKIDVTKGDPAYIKTKELEDHTLDIWAEKTFTSLGIKIDIKLLDSSEKELFKYGLEVTA